MVRTPPAAPPPRSSLCQPAPAQLAAAQSPSVDTVVADTRSALDALYAATDVTGPLADGKQAVDLASLDRRALYAMAANIGEKFFCRRAGGRQAGTAGAL